MESANLCLHDRLEETSLKDSGLTRKDALCMVEQALRAAKQARRVAEEAREESATLLECLSSVGVLRRQQFLAALHKSRFEAMCRAHPLQSKRVQSHHESRIASEAVLGTVELAGKRIAGLWLHGADRRILSAVSGSVHKAVVEVAKPSRVQLYICGGSSSESGTDHRHCVRFSPKLGNWEVLPQMLQHRAVAVGAVIAGLLYVCGGIDNFNEALDSAERFDPMLGQWEQLPRMLQRRYMATGAVVRKKLYVCGGRDGGSGAVGDAALSSSERFDPELGRWERLPDMSGERSAAVSGVIQDRLYICGGGVEAWRTVRGGTRDIVLHLNTAERLNPTIDQWETLPTMWDAHFGGAGGALGGCLYVCGGVGTGGGVRRRSAERFDPRLGRWEVLPLLLEPRCYALCIAFVGNLYIFGGAGDDRVCNTAERFDPVRGVWEALPDMAEGRIGARGVVIGNGGGPLRGCIYVCGGAGDRRMGGDDHSRGRDLLTSAECFDPESWCWETLPPMAQAHVGAVAAALAVNDT